MSVPMMPKNEAENKQSYNILREPFLDDYLCFIIQALKKPTKKIPKEPVLEQEACQKILKHFKKIENG